MFNVYVQEQMEIKFGGDQSNEMGGVGEVVSVQHEEALVWIYCTEILNLSVSTSSLYTLFICSVDSRNSDTVSLLG